jgi:hypothetical protein
VSDASSTYLGHLLHVCDHLIIALSLLAEPGEEGLAVGRSAERTGVHRRGVLIVPFALQERRTVSKGPVKDEIRMRRRGERGR